MKRDYYKKLLTGNKNKTRNLKKEIIIQKKIFPAKKPPFI